MKALDKRNVIDMFKEHFVLLITSDNRRFLYLAIVYAMAISLLTLAVPVSVQMLINTIANIASVKAILILSFILFSLLMFSGALILLQTYALELFERRYYACLTAQFTLRTVMAKIKHYRRINGSDLINRYFDIMHVQKIVPALVAGLVGTLLQMIVGILLVSFYHPWLFLFNLVFVVALVLTCWYWGKRAMRTSISVSEAKYETARHLEDLAFSSELCKSEIRTQFAVQTSDSLVNDYVHERALHFRNTITQKGALLLLYALASSVLLGLGGMLVVRAELTLGQLVAAELILSAVFFAISNLSNYLIQFYDLSAAMEEINRVYELPQEPREAKAFLPLTEVGDITFDGVESGGTREPKLKVDLHISKGQKLLIKASSSSVHRGICDLLQYHQTPERGRILLSDQDMLDYDPMSVRDKISVIDRTSIVETSIVGYMRIYAPTASRAQINDALDIVGLTHVVEELSGGIETEILTSGYPLRASEILRLKLAAVLLSRPSLIVLNEYFDSISYDRRQQIFARLCDMPDLTLLYFSNRHDLSMFNRYLYLTLDEQYEFEDIDSLRAFETEYERGQDA